MKIAAMIHHFHGGTSIVTVPVPEGRTVRQACDDVWATLNDPGEPSDGDVIVNSGQPGDIISFVGIIPFAQRHAVVESTGFTTFMTTEFAVRHVADRTTVLHGVRIYGLKPSPEPEDGQPLTDFVSLVISGGQSGVDTVGLDVARAFGIPTGGTAPHGWFRFSDTGILTRDEALLRSFGLVEGPPDPRHWPVRTRLNARNSDLTVWFGKESAGLKCTWNGCYVAQKPLLENPSPEALVEKVRSFGRPITMNVAGNRRHTNIGASNACRACLVQTFKTLSPAK